MKHSMKKGNLIVFELICFFSFSTAVSNRSHALGFDLASILYFILKKEKKKVIRINVIAKQVKIC